MNNCGYSWSRIVLKILRFLRGWHIHYFTSLKFDWYWRTFLDFFQIFFSRLLLIRWILFDGGFIIWSSSTSFWMQKQNEKAIHKYYEIRYSRLVSTFVWWSLAPSHWSFLHLWHPERYLSQWKDPPSISTMILKRDIPTHWHVHARIQLFLMEAFYQSFQLIIK